MNKVNKIIQQAEQHCQDRGKRLTVKRKQVLSALIQSEKALSAYELMDYFKEHYGKSIPAMSIYRILEFLENEHLVHRLNLVNKYVACSHIHCHPAHGESQFLICRECSKVTEICIDSSTITELKANAQEAGYTLITPQLEMDCICTDCSAQSVK